jgi:putative transcriptional regulator
MNYFDGCGFGKYCYIWFRLSLLVPSDPSHNLLVRGSNPCGGIFQSVSSWRARAVQTNKTNYMSDEAFGDLKEALEGALAFERGERRDLKVTRIQAPRPPKAMSPKDIARIREKLNCSQAVFAMMLNVSPKTVQAWEQGSREPGDAALKLLTIAKRHPEVLLET